MTTKMADSELDEILVTLVHGNALKVIGGKAFESGMKSPGVQEAKAALLAWHQKELARITDYVIGEDEKGAIEDFAKRRQSHNNALRAEMRNRLKELNNG